MSLRVPGRQRLVVESDLGLPTMLESEKREVKSPLG